MVAFKFLSFALFHAVIPAVCVALYGASPIWILGSIPISFAVFRTTQHSNTPIVKSILCIVSGLSMFLTLMLGVSYYMQGTGFNDQYFYHLDVNTLCIAVQAYGAVFFPSVLFLILAFFAPLVFYRQRISIQSSILPAALLWIVALATIYPAYSLVAYRAGFSDELSVTMPQLPTDIAAAFNPDPVPVLADTERSDDQLPNEASNQVKKNIILIYAESLEQLYFDETIFGDLVPNIKELSKNAHQYSNVYQVPGTTWTIAGIVASQCGFPLVINSPMANNSTMASIETPFANEECLADILQDNGYETAYMGGAPLSFAGKGNFLKTHGYQQVMGREELAPMLQDPRYQMGFGLYDDRLFELAVKELEALESGDKPYLLTLLTLDTHHPKGHPSRSCKSLLDNVDPMSNAVFCSDQLISKFIKKARDITNMEETVIVLISDHLALRNTLWDKLMAHKNQRRLTWMIFDNQPGTQSDQVATHFDVAPTLLAKAGIDGYSTLNQGTSLLAPQDHGMDGPSRDVDVEQVPPSPLSVAMVKESGFEISYEDLTITVGDLSVKANKYGKKLSSGLFLLVLDEESKVLDTVYSDNFTRLTHKFDGLFVVGISLTEKGSETGNQYFFGRFSQDLGKMTLQPFDSDVHVDPSELGI